MVTYEANVVSVNANRSHAGLRHAGHREAIDDDVRGIFQIDAVLRAGSASGIHEHAGLGKELDWRASLHRQQLD